MSVIEPVSHKVATQPLLSDKAYDVLKKIAQIYLPALGALYFGLAAIWGLPAAEQVSGTVLAVDTFLGVILGLASKSYNNSDAKYAGEIVIADLGQDAPKQVNFSLNSHPDDWNGDATFKVTYE